MDPYLAVKWLHILSSTVLFGTGIGTAFQMVWAMRRGEPRIVHGVATGVVVADWIFTTPAGFIQPITGAILVHFSGFSFFEPWLVATYGLYLLALACWLPVVALQIRIRDLARAAASGGEALPDEARRLYRIWFALGWPAFGALVAVFWLMVARPDLGF
ncbi:DUF2269 domain-containing protein [Defluviimonas sp. WL0024]|uniref:DUF2269 domain-containing protein n=1 Tax=Albidovulum salinarum TaxID=2984153 RepID=A0ABT2X5X3_9RHOB|nr:DUF2269 domain-containing protein [Defluviimonas sp. WL0024]MCU9847210.1 DUF2269 domain-containing protein [Defluviimonas sp. WL0024]